MSAEKLPKRIWILWFQGKENMPEVVKSCYASWQHHNPDWEVNLLDGSNYDKYVDVKEIFENRETEIPVEKRSNIIRVNLLKKYGGVWVDATCYCIKPLDNWLPQCATSGFFAFSRPTRDKMIDNWFLASYKDNYLMRRLCDNENKFWINNPSINPLNKYLRFHYWFPHLLSFFHIKPYIWHSLILRFFYKYHYFRFHYQFEELYNTDQEFKRVWDETSKVLADLPIRLHSYGIHKRLNSKIKREIDNQIAPLYKLTWKLGDRSFDENSIYTYLLSKNRSNM
ncbi:MAG: capsular polysaccharide synthesis protein [Bacteroidota bacterium]